MQAGAESILFIEKKWITWQETVRVCVCVLQYSNRREFDLHVGVRELTQARLHWDKSSGLSGILKRSWLSLNTRHTRTPWVSTHNYTKKQTHPRTHTLTPTLAHTEATGACQNGEPCQIKEEVCALCSSLLETGFNTHSRAHTYFGQLPKIPGAGSFCPVLHYFPSSWRHTHTHDCWCLACLGLFKDFDWSLCC